MTSRRLLWTAFGLAALPLFFVATTGCDVVFGLKEIRHDNALRCSCSCDDSGTRTLVVNAGSDDAQQSGSTVNLTSNELDLGQQIVGIRFDNVMLPAGATIISATVQFTASGNDAADTSLTIAAERSVSAPTFTTDPDNLSGRTVTASIPWSALPAWTNGATGLAQQTPDLSQLIQELVDLPGWSNSSAIVLRIEGTGHRRARSFDGSAAKAPLLVVSYDASVAATLPVCARPDIERDENGGIKSTELPKECARVEETVQGLAGYCGYPASCHCDVVEVPDHSATFPSDVCAEDCSEEVPDPQCSNFDPNAFADCLAQSASVDACKQYLAATNAPGIGTPVCVASGSPLAFHLFGTRSLCEVEGTSDITVDGRKPKSDPKTTGIVEILGRPCPGGSCSVHPYFDLNMDPVTFEVRFASDPTFKDLSASGRGKEAAVFDSSAGEVSLVEDAVRGTGTGRRGVQALAIEATNDSPLDIGIDWAAHLCDMNGDLATQVGDDGLCDGDDATPCSADSPDCDGAGGPCVFSENTTDMSVVVSLSGTLVNQPPSADAGPEQQSVECTSPGGAPFVLDGRGSDDPDQNLALATWRRGSRTGLELSKDLIATDDLPVGASQTYVLRVVDSFAQTDEDETEVTVQDTTPPEIACNAPPTIKPQNAPLSLTATATDVCDADVPAVVTGYDCYTFTKSGRRVDKLSSCVVSFSGDTLTIIDSGGIGNHVEWSVNAVDDSGNSETVTCELIVVK